LLIVVLRPGAAALSRPIVADERSPRKTL
jgi:hypothetical protein